MDNNVRLFHLFVAAFTPFPLRVSDSNAFCFSALEINLPKHWHA